MELTASAASSKNTKVHHHRKFSGVRCLVFLHSFGLTVTGPVYSEVVIPQSTSYSEMARTPPNTRST